MADKAASLLNPQREAWEHAVKLQRSKNLTHYQVLQVSKRATAEEIRVKYKRLALQLHPDKFKPPEEVTLTAEQIESMNPMTKINQAWAVLSDPSRRQDYDGTLEEDNESRDSRLMADDDDEDDMPSLNAGLLGGDDSFDELRNLADKFAQDYQESSITPEKNPMKLYLEKLAPVVEEIERVTERSMGISAPKGRPKPRCEQCGQEFNQQALLFQHVNQLHNAYIQSLQCIAKKLPQGKSASISTLFYPEQFRDFLPSEAEFRSTLPTITIRDLSWLTASNAGTHTSANTTLGVDRQIWEQCVLQCRQIAAKNSTASIPAKRTSSLLSPSQEGPSVRRALDAAVNGESLPMGDSGKAVVVGTVGSTTPIVSATNLPRSLTSALGGSVPTRRVIEPPAWAKSSKCWTCDKSFALWNRRSHCRCCGRSFCRTCLSTERTLVLVQFGETSHRHMVCSDCHRAVMNEVNTALLQRLATPAVQPNLHLETQLSALHIADACFRPGAEFWTQRHAHFASSPWQVRLVLFSFSKPNSQTWIRYLSSFSRSEYPEALMTILASSASGDAQKLALSVTTSGAYASDINVLTTCAPWLTLDDLITIVYQRSVETLPEILNLTLAKAGGRNERALQQVIQCANKPSQYSRGVIVRVLSLILAGSEVSSNVKIWSDLIQHLNSSEWPMLVHGITTCLGKDCWKTLFMLIVSDGDLEAAEWVLRRDDGANPQMWLDLAAMCFLEGILVDVPEVPWAAVRAKRSNATPWTTQLRRAIDTFGRLSEEASGKKPSWSELAWKFPDTGDMVTWAKQILCVLKGASSTSPPPEIWAEAAREFAQHQMIAQARICLSGANKKPLEFWTELASATQSKDYKRSAYFLTAKFYNSPPDLQTQIAVQIASALRNAGHPSWAIEILAMLLVSQDFKSALKPSGVQRATILLAYCFKDMKQSSTVILETMKAARDIQLDSAPAELLASIASMEEKAVEEARQEFAKPAYTLLSASFEYGNRLTDLLLAAFNENNELVIEEFLRLYKLRVVLEEEDNEEKLAPQIRAVILLAEGLLRVIRQDVSVGARKLLAAVELGRNDGFATLVSQVLSDPSARLCGLLDMRETITLAKSFKDILSARWLSTPQDSAAFTPLDSSVLAAKFVTPPNIFHKRVQKLLIPIRRFEFAIANTARKYGAFEGALQYINLARCAGFQAISLRAFLQAVRYLLLTVQDSSVSPPNKYAAFRLATVCIAAALKRKSNMLSRLYTVSTALSLLLWMYILCPSWVTADEIEFAADITKELVDTGQAVPVFALSPTRAYDGLLIDTVLRGVSQKTLLLLQDKLCGILAVDRWTCLKLQAAWTGWLIDDSPKAKEDEEEEEEEALSDSGASEQEAEDREDRDDDDLEDEETAFNISARDQRRAAQRAERRAQRLEEKRRRAALREAREQERERRFLDNNRFEAVSRLLENANCRWEEVASLIDCEALPRDAHGFLDVAAGRAVYDKLQFSSFDGFKISKSTGHLQWKLTPTSSKNPGNFSWQDIADAVNLAIFQPIFSLDEIDSNLPYNPLQLMRFSPVELRQTRLLSAMFHADYVLKFLTCGVEISSRPPFALRPTAEGLLKGLPRHLVSALGTCVDSPTIGEEGKLHRFWVAAGDLIVDRKENESEISITVGTQQMGVKKHLMTRNPRTGELEDSKLPESDTSPEAQFARLFSTHYDEIANYYPVFRRLRELCKISAMVEKLYLIKEQVNANVVQLEAARSRIYSETMTSLPNDLRADPFPAASDYNVRSTIDKALADQNVPYNLREQTRNKYWSEVRTAAAERDSKLVQDVASQLSTLDVPRSSLETAIRQHLSGDRTGTTVLATAISKRNTPQLDELRSMAYGLREVGSPKERSGLCTGPVGQDSKGWIPAVFRKGPMSMVFGGVSLCPKEQFRAVHPPPTSTYHNSAVSLAAQRANVVPGSFAQQLDNAARDRAVAMANARQYNHQVWEQQLRQQSVLHGYRNHGLFGEPRIPKSSWVRGSQSPGVLNPDIVLHRVWSGNPKNSNQAQMIGGWHSLQTWPNRAVAMQQSAVITKWNSMQVVSQVRYPAGTPCTYSVAAPQYDPQTGKWLGGGAVQVFIDRRYQTSAVVEQVKKTAVTKPMNQGLAYNRNNFWGGFRG